MPFTEEQLIEIFGDDLPEILSTLNQLPLNVEKMLLSVLSQMVYDVTIFDTNLEKSVLTMFDNGVTKDIIQDTLEVDLQTGGRIFGELKNNTKASIVNAINQSAKMGQYQNYDLSTGLFRWITVGGHKICIDCESRTGLEKTFEEWEKVGLPGSGWSLCQGYCYCVLDPTGEISNKISTDVQEKIPR